MSKQKQSGSRFKIQIRSEKKMAKKIKKFPGESDSNVFARVASRAVREAREDNRGELGQTIRTERADLLRELENLADAARLVVSRWSSGDLADAVNGLRVDASPAWKLVRMAKKQKSSPVFVVISGGVAEVVSETVPAGMEVEIIDYDNLKAGGANELAKLSPAARVYVKENS
jgi:hypothetical protein